MYSETVLHKKAQVLPEKPEITEWLEAIPAGIVIIDVNGVILHANNIACELFDFTAINARWETALKKNVKGISDNGHYIFSQSGKHIVLKTQALPDRKGQIVLLLDESELKKDNESKITLEKIDSIGKLSAALAHQLRTPLSTAMLYVSNLGLDNISIDDIKKYQHRIMNQLVLIKQQIEEVLLVYKGGEVLLEKFDLAAEMLCISEDFKALHPDIELNFYQAKDVETCYVWGNRQSLRGAFNNIVDNAVHASATNDKIDIKLFKKEENLIIEVIDNGQGMSQDVIAKVMKGFYSTKDTGNGLGLSIARSVIEAHQGRLTIESEVAQYTKIAVMIPMLKD